MGQTVLVVGVGRFGTHYARILSAVNRDLPPGVPSVDRLVLTRRHRAPARKLADAVRQAPGCTVSEVIGEPVADGRELISALNRFDPDLTCITATDPRAGDAVHLDYSQIVLQHSRSRVLCEKPLCPATGDGASVQAALRLRESDDTGRFGLELPMAVVRQKMQADPDLGHRLATASRLGFLWSTTAPLRSDLLNTLALHPWSLIPKRLSPERVESRCAPGRCEITGRLRDRETGAGVALEIVLSSGGNERTVAIDGFPFHILSRGATVSIRPGATGVRNASVDALPVVENPLKQNIVASLAGDPVTGLDRTLRAQRFLELSKGWQNG